MQKQETLFLRITYSYSFLPSFPSNPNRIIHWLSNTSFLDIIHILTQHEYNTAFIFFATYYLRFLLLKFLWAIYQHSLLLSAKNPLTLAETVLQLIGKESFFGREL